MTAVVTNPCPQTAIFYAMKYLVCICMAGNNVIWVVIVSCKQQNLAYLHEITVCFARIYSD